MSVSQTLPLYTSNPLPFVSGLSIFQVSNADFNDDKDRDLSTTRAKIALETLQMGVAREGVRNVCCRLLPSLDAWFGLGLMDSSSTTDGISRVGGIEFSHTNRVPPAPAPPPLQRSRLCLNLLL